MKRHVILWASVLISVSICAADIPEGYYDAIEGTQDSVLKSTLYNIIKGGERYFYGNNEYHTSSNPPEWQKGDLKGYGTWYAFPMTDMHPDGIIWDMYSNCVRYYPKDKGESGCSLNIEHCLPKSWWGTGVKTDTIYRDLYNLNPSDAQANSNKSNYAPGHVSKGDKFDNGSFRMDSKAKSQYNYICWEPAEEYRGDFARTYFYMVTAYEEQTWSDTYSAYVSNDSYLRFSPTIVQVLLDWHRADPVSDKERCRADRISDIQGNRNPYIDYPELVEYIWGEQKGQTVDLASLTCAFQSGVCPEPIVPEPDPQTYDTLINLPGLTKAIVNAYTNGEISGFASDKIQSNGTRSITMGASTTDGYLSFNHLNLTDSAILDFRASIFNTADSMQLDIYANETLIRTIKDKVVQNTRNELYYRTTIPAGTDSIKIISVGGKTTIRACMQELYLLQAKGDPTAVIRPQDQLSISKELREGQVVIIRNTSIFTPLGQEIR